MMAQDLSDLYSDVNNVAQKFVKLSATFNTADHAKIDVFGVIVSSTLPKRCGARASHKYCCSFSIIDPSHPLPTGPVCVNLFLNNPANFAPAYTIGDVIYCRDMRLQKYRDFPQLVGNFEKSTIVTFRNINQTIVDNVALTNAHLREEDWEIHCYTGTRVTVRDIDSLLSNAVIRLSNWAHEFFKTKSMEEPTAFPHSSLHTLHHHYHTFHSSSDAYKQQYPPNIQSIPAPSIAGMVGPEMCKVDVIGLVVSNIKGTGAAPTRLLLWDGTGNGYYPTIPGAAHHVSIIDRALTHAAADAAEVWTQIVQRSKQLTNPAAATAVANGNPQNNTNQTINSSSNNVNSTNTNTSNTAAVLPWDKEIFLGSFLVVESHDLPDQNVHQSFLTSFQPGRWIRLRNITIHSQRTDYGVPVGEVRVDAHVSFLQPYFRDVRTLLGAYFVRTHQHLTILEHQKKQEQLLLQQQQQQEQQQLQARRAQTSATTTQQQQQQQLQRHRSEQGHFAIALAWVMALPAPPVDKMAVEFYCAGYIRQWYPLDTKKFVQVSENADGSFKYFYLFSLRLDDNTEPAQIIFADQQAERLLGGVTAEEYHANPKHAIALENKLVHARNNGSIIGLYIRLYTKKLLLPPGKRRARNAPKKRILKRLMAFNTTTAYFPLQDPVVQENTQTETAAEVVPDTPAFSQTSMTRRGKKLVAAEK